MAESHPKVMTYVKNHSLGLKVPYRSGSSARTYIPDFIVQVDDGHGKDDPLNLVVEIKGYRNEDARAKKLTMDTYWVPGVNNLHRYGRWAFAEFTDVFDIEAGFDTLINQTLAQRQSGEHQSFEGLNFKELLTAAPLEGIDLARTRELPRDIEL